jgi:hypothetical protein
MKEYPEKKDLEKIKKWEYTDCKGLFLFIQSIWHFGEDYCKLKGRRIHLITGGWSGNEDIVGALEKNYMVWCLTWQKSVRGGSFYFLLPRKEPQKKGESLG